MDRSLCDRKGKTVSWKVTCLEMKTCLVARLYNLKPFCIRGYPNKTDLMALSSNLSGVCWDAKHKQPMVFKWEYVGVLWNNISERVLNFKIELGILFKR